MLTDNCCVTGAGESGKSTVLKQMKLIYATGFSKNEKLEWKPVVFNNIIQSFRLIHDAMTELNIAFETAESEVRRSTGIYCSPQMVPSYPPRPEYGLTCHVTAEIYGANISRPRTEPQRPLPDRSSRPNQKTMGRRGCEDCHREGQRVCPA